MNLKIDKDFNNAKIIFVPNLYILTSIGGGKLNIWWFLPKQAMRFRVDKLGIDTHTHKHRHTDR